MWRDCAGPGGGTAHSAATTSRRTAGGRGSTVASSSISRPAVQPPQPTRRAGAAGVTAGAPQPRGKSPPGEGGGGHRLGRFAGDRPPPAGESGYVEPLPPGPPPGPAAMKDRGAERLDVGWRPP